MREILAKTRFGDDIFLYWEFRQGMKFYYDISCFVSADRNYDAYASLAGFIGSMIRRKGFVYQVDLQAFTTVMELSRKRIPSKELARITSAMQHLTSFDVAKYGRSLLNIAFRVK